jgi:dTMP kinase
MLIAVEGIDGAGKSTQIPKIAAWFESLGMKACITAEPTKGPFGQKIRQATQERHAPIIERQLFVDDRKEHLKTCIQPALERGEIVITDRYLYSSVAYQGSRRDAFDHDPTQAELEALQDEIYAENRAFAPEADILIYIQIDVDTAIERMKNGRETLDPFEKKQTLIDVSNAFDRLMNKGMNVIAVDGTLPPEQITAAILAPLGFLLSNCYD